MEVERVLNCLMSCHQILHRLSTHVFELLAAGPFNDAQEFEREMWRLAAVGKQSDHQAVGNDVSLEAARAICGFRHCNSAGKVARVR